MSFRITVTLTDEEGREMTRRALDVTAVERSMVSYTALAARYIRTALASGNVAESATPAALAPHQDSASTVGVYLPPHGATLHLTDAEILERSQRRLRKARTDQGINPDTGAPLHSGGVPLVSASDNPGPDSEGRKGAM